MSDVHTYAIVFSGEVAKGFELQTVKNKAAQLFKMDAQKVESLFRGDARTLKKSLDESAAKKYQKILTQIGMVVSISAENVANQEVSEREEERLQDQKLEEKQGESVQWQVEAAGVSLLGTSEMANNDTKTVLVPAYDLAPVAQNLLNADEVKTEAAAPDLSEYQNMTLHEVGEDILEAEEKKPLITATIDTQNLRVDSTGGELLAASEKNIIEPSTINTDDIQLSSH